MLIIQNWKLKLSGLKKIRDLLFAICLTLFVFYGGYKMSMEQVSIQIIHHNMKMENK